MAAGCCFAAAAVSCFAGEVVADGSLVIAGWGAVVGRSCCSRLSLVHRCCQNTTRSVASIVSGCLDWCGVVKHCSTVVGILLLFAGNLVSETQVVIASFERYLDLNQADDTVPGWLELS